MSRTAAQPNPAAAAPADRRGFNLPSLDGLRAVSVVIVFVSHIGFADLVPGGFGVTVFFFLSGFLITTLLRREFAATRDVSFKDFYLRRVFRILPPMYITLLFALLLNVSGFMPRDLELAPMLLQVANFANYVPILFENGEAKVPVGTGIFWSLSVEEHFYAIYPLVALALLKAGSVRRTFWTLAAICLVVLLWRTFLVTVMGVESEKIYRATDCRIDSMLYGCILALCANPVLDPRPQRSTRWDLPMLAASMALLLVTLLVRNEVFRETLRYSLQGLALMPVFYLAISRPDWWPFKWLNTGPMRWIGTLSYTIYLCQLIMIAIVWRLWPQWPAMVQYAMMAALTLLYSMAMYRFVEKPCGRMRARIHDRAEQRRRLQDDQAIERELSQLAEGARARRRARRARAPVKQAIS